MEKCNETLVDDSMKKVVFIGVLDIAGFEIFDVSMHLFDICELHISKSFVKIMLILSSTGSSSCASTSAMRNCSSSSTIICLFWSRKNTSRYNLKELRHETSHEIDINISCTVPTSVVRPFSRCCHYSSIFLPYYWDLRCYKMWKCTLVKI